MGNRFPSIALVLPLLAVSCGRIGYDEVLGRGGTDPVTTDDRDSSLATNGGRAAPPMFFVTAQPGAGQAQCGPTGIDDVYGCGTLGGVPNADCAPLDAWSGDGCKALTAPWACSRGSEALSVVKPGASGGGVLCCRD